MTEKDIKEYFKRKMKDQPMKKYASFNFLLYLAKVVDIQTAENIGNQIYEENINCEIVDSLVDNILNYYG